MSQRLALIIGNSVYLDGTLSRLLTPDADVGALGELLLDPERGRFDDVKVMVNMSSHIIRRTIASFFAKKTRDDLLMFYFSGHGVLDDQGQLFLAVRDTDSRLLSGTAIPASYITAEMNNSHSQRQILVLDCCHSGAFARGSKGQIGASVGTAAAFEGTGYGRVVLTASDATQFAWEGNQVIGQVQNSLFTHYLIDGIKTGKADLNLDGQITVDELYDYAYEQVVLQTSKQTPGKWSYKERGEIIIATVPTLASPTSLRVKLPDLDQDEELRVEQLYNEGLSAFWLEEWDNAVRCFEAIVEARGDYKDSVNKLEQSKRSKLTLALYNQALSAEAAGEWKRVITCLEELATHSPSYKDSASRLEAAKCAHQLGELYKEARQLSQAEKWQAVVSIFSTIIDLQPDYPDPEGLLPMARQKVAEIKCQQAKENFYIRALHEMDSSNWGDARATLIELQKMEFGYRESERLLEVVEARIAEQQTIHQTADALALEQSDQIQSFDLPLPERPDLDTTTTKNLKEIIKVSAPKPNVVHWSIFIVGTACAIALIMLFVYPWWQTRSSTTTPTDLFLISDAFNQQEFEGGYNSLIWDTSTGDPSFIITQEDGWMKLSAFGNNLSSEIHMKETYNLILAEPYYLEATSVLDESAHAANLGFVFGFAEGNTECQIKAWSQDQICCWTNFKELRHELPCQVITPGTWHTVRIELYSIDPIIFDYIIDGEHIGSIQPVMDDIPETVSEAFVHLTSYTKRLNLAFIDKISFGAINTR